MKDVGTTEHGEVVELNRKAVESDLVIYVNLNLVPMDGGHKSVAVGPLRLQEPARAPQPADDARLLVVHGPGKSALATSVDAHGAPREQDAQRLHIETTVNNRMFDRPLEFLHKNEDDLDGRRDARRFKALTLHAVASSRSRRARRSSSASRRRTASPASSPARPRRCTSKTLERVLRAVPRARPGPGRHPRHGHPVHQPVQRELVPEPAARAGDGAGLPLQPLPGRAAGEEGRHDDHLPPVHRPVRQGAPRSVHRVRPQPPARDARRASSCTSSYEEKFATNPAYIEMYRTGHAYHPAHPFFMWYWGEAGRQHLGRVIVVGADNEYIPKLLGWETARTMRRGARHGARAPRRDRRRSRCSTSPPIVMADVTV